MPCARDAHRRGPSPCACLSEAVALTPLLNATPQGKPNAMWRVLSILPYLVPLMGSLAFGQDLYAPHLPYAPPLLYPQDRFPSLTRFLHL